MFWSCRGWSLQSRGLVKLNIFSCPKTAIKVPLYRPPRHFWNIARIANAVPVIFRKSEPFLKVWPFSKILKVFWKSETFSNFQICVKFFRFSRKNEVFRKISGFQKKFSFSEKFHIFRKKSYFQKNFIFLKKNSYFQKMTYQNLCKKGTKPMEKVLDQSVIPVRRKTT